MDYTRMLFATKVRELLIARYLKRMPPDLSEEAKSEWKDQHRETFVAEILADINRIADAVDKVDDQTS